MKIYSTIVTVIAALSLFVSGYLYIQNGEVEKCMQERDSFADANLGFQKQVENMTKQVDSLKTSAVLFKSVVNSFMYAGDIKALSIGSIEGMEVENNIQNLTDSMDRMNAEKNWGEFKDTLGFNPVFGLLRSIADGMVRTADLAASDGTPVKQPINEGNPIPPSKQ